MNDSLCTFFLDHIKFDSSQKFNVLWDPELNARTSDCCTLQAAGFLAFWGKKNGRKEFESAAVSLVEGIDFSDPFRGAYNVSIGLQGNFDLAEVGASFRSFESVQRLLPASKVGRIIDSVSSLVLSNCVEGRPGAYYKNSDACDFDVLNGDIYAAVVLSSCDRIMGSRRFAGQVQDTVNHLISRFNVDIRMGWAYSEDWAGEVKVGFSTAYQATIIAWGALLLRELSDDLQHRWRKVLWSAQQRVVAAVSSNNVIENEAPSWARNWKETWEIDLAYSRWSSLSFYSQLNTRLKDLCDNYDRIGMKVFEDSRPSNPDRTPLGSIMRKACNFASITQSMLCGSPVVLGGKAVPGGCN